MRPQLDSLKKNKDDIPVIDLMMVSHIDDDHINGILDLTEELMEAEEENRKPIVDIHRAWHNSFSDLILNDKQPAKNKPASVNGIVASAFHDFLDEYVGFEDSEMVMAGVRQGRELRINLNALHIRTNSMFDNCLLYTSPSPRDKRQSRMPSSA